MAVQNKREMGLLFSKINARDIHNLDGGSMNEQQYYEFPFDYCSGQLEVGLY